MPQWCIMLHAGNSRPSKLAYVLRACHTDHSFPSLSARTPKENSSSVQQDALAAYAHFIGFFASRLAFALTIFPLIGGLIGVIRGAVLGLPTLHPLDIALATERGQ